MKFNDLSLIVSDMQKSLDFYRTLGLRIPADATQDHVEIEQGGLRIAWEPETLMRQLDAGWTGRVCTRSGLARCGR